LCPNGNESLSKRYQKALCKKMLVNLPFASTGSTRVAVARRNEGTFGDFRAASAAASIDMRPAVKMGTREKVLERLKIWGSSPKSVSIFLETGVQ
jgi:hypothetical protein